MTVKEDCFSVAIPVCYFCGREKNELIMNKILTPNHAKKVKEAHGKVVDMEPCDECKKMMEQGVMLIQCKDGNQDYRTGVIIGVKDEAIPKIFPPEYAESALKMRAMFIEQTAWRNIGLPEGTEDEE